MRALARVPALFAVPAAILGAGFVLVYYSAALPASLAGLKVYGPYILAAAGAALAVAFNRGRVVAALAVLAAAYGAQQLWLAEGLGAFPARVSYAALTVFVPLNLAALAVLPERGTFNRHGALRLAVLLAQAAFAAWVVWAGQTAIVDWAYQKFLDPSPISAGRLPQLAVFLIASGMLVALIASLVTRSAINASFAGAIAAFAVAAHVPSASTTFAIFTAMAELMVMVGVLQDTFRMAFRDELTGLPSRRALNERLMALPRTYTVAMLDVDHFKQFNDTYGHDLGDQVLKMAASHIGRVGGGGKAFRYGGEEFTVLFPGLDLKAAIPHLEALRKNIAAYRLALRGADRPRKVKGDKRKPGAWRGKDSVSVTVSIGVAERNERLQSPDAVLQAADRALYRAKEKGRNQVSR